MFIRLRKKINLNFSTVFSQTKFTEGSKSKSMNDKNSVYSMMSPNEFKELKQLGKGSFGRVSKVQKLTGTKTKDNVYAMKVLSKSRLKEKDRLRTLLERRVLKEFKHPFIITCHYAFQTESDLFLILDFAAGGDLFSLLAYKFSENRTRFIIVCHDSLVLKKAKKGKKN